MKLGTRWEVLRVERVTTLHEMALMEGVVRTIEVSAAVNGITRVRRVRLVVGEFTAALPEALSLAFGVLTRGTVLAEADLEIEEQELLLVCRACGHRFHPEEYWFICPACSAREVEIVQGRDLYVDFYEGDEAREGVSGSGFARGQ